jgi:hypothetical protein
VPRTDPKLARRENASTDVIRVECSGRMGKEDASAFSFTQRPLGCTRTSTEPSSHSCSICHGIGRRTAVRTSHCVQSVGLFPRTGNSGLAPNRLSEMRLCFEWQCSFEFSKKQISILEYWLRLYATSREVAGSIPCEVIRFFILPNSSSRTMALELNQPLTEISTRNIPAE